MLSEPVVFSWHDRCCTNPHELCEKFIHPAFSYFAAVLLRWLGGRRVLLDTCKLFRTCPQTCRCPCGRHSNQSNSSAGTNRIDRRSLRLARFPINSSGFAGAFRTGHRTCGLLLEIHATAFDHVNAAASFRV